MGKYKKHLIPCQAEELAQEIYALQGHYWQQGMPIELMKSVAADYARFLDGYSLSVVRKACDEWKLSTNSFFPKIGQLKEMMESKKAILDQKIKRLTVLIENAK